MTKRHLMLFAIAAMLGWATICIAAEGGRRVRETISSLMASFPSRWPSGDTSLGSGSVLYRLSGAGGGVWHARLEGDKVTTGQGEIDDARATVECAARDFLAILEGRADAVALYMTGKLRVLGDLEFAQGFHTRVLSGGPGQGTVKTDTTGWFAFEPLRIERGVRTAADASELLDPPAGKHGFLRVRGSQFVFEDGTPVRFWGTNIVAGNVFMDHETAERTAARLARFGCNMVRLHHMDADWAKPNIFDNSYDDTQHFSAESLDRLDYLIYQLKEHGIYVYLDLLVHRKFKAGDGVRDWERVENGAKIVAHFDRRIIELQRKYAHDLYTHVNKYTRLRYCDDPAIAMSELINESSLFWAGGYGSVPPSYIEDLNERYREWARQRKLAVPEGASVPEGLRQRDPQVLEFLYETQVAYFTEMRGYLGSIGVKVPVAGSNHWEAMALDLKSNLVMDYLDRHGYWDHPQGGWGPDARFDNRPMVKSGYWNLVTWLSPHQAVEKPLIITEWNCCWINEYIAEGPLTMAAYGALQGWDGLLQFDYSGGDWADRLAGPFDVGNKPHVLATWPAAARLFLRGHVKAGQPVIFRRTDDEARRGVQVGEGLPARAGARDRLSFAFSRRRRALSPSELAPVPELAVSSTGQLTWDAEGGLITANAPASAVRLGFAGGPVEAGPVSFHVTPQFSVVAVTALDDRPIPASKHLLITAVARAENSGMAYVASRTSATDAGRPPILIEPVRGRVCISLQGPVASVSASALDAVGRPRHAIGATVEGSALTIPLQADAFWYEVTIAR